MEGQTNKQRKVFSGLIFTTAQVVHVSARITFIHVFIRSSNIWISYILSRLLITSRLYWNRHKDQLPVGLLAQLVERCTSITEIMGPNHVQAWIFFRPYFHYCSSSAHYCEDHFHSRKESLLWQNQHSKNNIYLIKGSLFHLTPT